MHYARIILLFFIYAFLGWCMEVAFAACKSGRFVNRGFLNGPVCPIYGFGMVGVAVLLSPLKDNLLWMYLGSAVITTVIEYITGWMLERIFHAKWWDYSDMPLNIGGYVCLLFSLIWGALCVVIVRYVHPAIAGLVEHLPNWLTIVLDGLFVSAIAVDLAATLATIRKLASRLSTLERMAGEIHSLSDNIGRRISDSTLAAKSRVEAGEARLKEETAKLESARDALSDRMASGRERVTEKLEQSAEASRQRLNELKAKFDAALEENTAGQRRLMNAFPNLKSRRNPEVLQALRERIERMRNERRKK
ncbi:MAG: hypothetical protein SOR74_11515 [Candidatus Faecivicinus sp.]|nr:hypothetical protein [Candidatus Faecivicinus sp.]